MYGTTNYGMNETKKYVIVVGIFMLIKSNPPKYNDYKIWYRFNAHDYVCSETSL